MPKEDALRFVRAGVDLPSAGQQNLIVGILKERERHASRVDVTDPDLFYLSTGWAAFNVRKITSMVNANHRTLTWQSSAFVGDNTDNFELVVCSGKTNRASLGNKPIIARLEGTPPVIGGQVGPRSGSNYLAANYPGFRYLGSASGPSGGTYGWVIRNRGFAKGFGYVTNDASMVGAPSTILLDDVRFSNGFSCYNSSLSFEVDNQFGDSVAEDTLVHFQWDEYSGGWISTDIACL